MQAYQLEEEEEPIEPMALLEIIREAIESGENDDLGGYVEAFPLLQIEEEQSNLLLKFLLETCTLHGNLEASIIIINYWEENNPEQVNYPIRTTLFTITGMDVETMGFVILGDEHGSYLSHMRKLFAYGTRPEVSAACHLLQVVYGDQSLEIYKVLLDELEAYREDTFGLTNGSIQEWVQYQYRMTSEYAPIPVWVKNYASNIALPTHDQLLAALPLPSEKVAFQVPDDEEAALRLTEDFFTLPGVRVDTNAPLREALQEALSTMSTKEKISMFKPLIEARSEYDSHSNTDIFRVLGPAHPISGTKDLDSRSDCPCDRYGGCRMMTCFEFENVDEYGEVIDEDVVINHSYDLLEWFSGSCDQCLLGIREKHHAVRMPMENGGWAGCYCSWKCVRDDINGRYPILVRMANFFEEQFLSIGIQDRTWETAATAASSGGSLQDFIEVTKRQHGENPEVVEPWSPSVSEGGSFSSSTETPLSPEQFSPRSPLPETPLVFSPEDEAEAEGWLAALRRPYQFQQPASTATLETLGRG